MANTPSNIRGGFVPDVYFGAPGATRPANTTIAPDPDDFVHFGLISAEGIVLGKSIDLQEVSAMGITNYPVYTRITKQESTIALTFMETRSEVLAVFNRVTTADMTTTAAVTGTGAHPQFVTLLDQPSNQPQRYSMLIDLTDGTYKNRRFYPNVQVASTGDLTFTTTGDPVGYQMTFKAVLGDDDAVPVEMWDNLILNAFPPVSS